MRYMQVITGYVRGRRARAYTVLLQFAGGPACESLEQPLTDVLHFAFVDREVVLLTPVSIHAVDVNEVGRR